MQPFLPGHQGHTNYPQDGITLHSYQDGKYGRAWQYMCWSRCRQHALSHAARRSVNLHRHSVKLYGSTKEAAHLQNLSPGNPTPRQVNDRNSFKYTPRGPWLVWLRGLSACLQTERFLVRSPDRTHAWVKGQVPSWGCERGNQSMYFSHMMFLFLSFFLPPPHSKK